MIISDVTSTTAHIIYAEEMNGGVHSFKANATISAGVVSFDGSGTDFGNPLYSVAITLQEKDGKLYAGRMNQVAGSHGQVSRSASGVLN